MITWVSFTTNLFLKAKLSIKNFIWRSLNYCETQSNKNDLKNGQQIIGFFYTIIATTTLHSDCEKVHFQTQCYYSRKSSPYLTPGGFYLFPELKMKLKGHRFVDSNEVIKNWWRNWRTSQKMDCRSVLDNFMNAERSVQMQEESTLKTNNVKLLL